MNDLKFAFRQLLKNPGFTAIAVLTLAVGIGAATAVFTILNGVLLQPPPYSRPEELVLVSPENSDGTFYNASYSGAQFAEWRAQAGSFAALAPYHWTFNFLVHPHGNESLEGLGCSADYFRVLGLEPFMGRTFTDEEKFVRDQPVILIGHAFWQRRFNSDPNIVGKIIRLSRLPPLTVIGVMPPGVRFLPSRRNAQEPNYNLHAPVDFWMPSPPNFTERRGRNWDVVGRLKPGRTAQQAQAEMTAIAARLAQSESDLAGITAKVSRLDEVLSGEVRRVLLPLLGAVGFVLLIASVNVASLLLVRGLTRQRELAVRAALGAGWLRLVRLALTESIVLAAIGGILGTLLAFAATKILIALAPNSIPRLDQVGVDLKVLGFALGVSLLTGLCVGVVPALRLLRPNLGESLKEGGRGGSRGPSHGQVLNFFVASEVALTLVLLVAAGLMLQTMSRLARVKPGYETEDILTMVVTTLGTNYSTFHRQALSSVSGLPGVQAAAFAWGLPLTGNKWVGNIEIEGRPTSTQFKDQISLPLRSVSADYFKVMGIRLKAGRNFSDDEGTNRVAIINETMARVHFPNEYAIGKRVKQGSGTSEIVGIVSDLKNTALAASAESEIYFSFFQAGAFSKHLVVRTKFDPNSLMRTIRSELRRVDPGVVVEEMKTMARIRSDSNAQQQFAMTLISLFSVVALGLSVIGIYGVMAHSVVQRTQEIGVRMALGAQRDDVFRWMLRRGMTPVIMGLLAGLASAFALTQFLRGLLFGISPSDPLTFIALPLVLAAVAALACWLPARGATRVDPMEALRYE
jgi:putative ABC transport system permease protein